MTVARPPQPTGTDYKSWGNRLNDYLVRTRSQLAYYIAGSSAINDGVLVWDADNSRILVSSNNAWVEVGSGGGGGTITNYLRDDQDDATAFRLTMGGLTVDTDTLYVDSVNNEVGIGTTNPSEKLEVVGNVEAIEFIGDLRGAVVFKAQAGEALAKGDVVYISGISGNTTVVNKADADDAAKMPAFGLAATSASNNTTLEIYTFGTLSGLDTSSYTEGDELFVGTTAGALVSTAPTGEGSSVQKIGKVTRSHASAGSIKIMGAGRTNATPNLNDGNIFIGDSNNQATTASLATQVSTLETSHDDVLVDGDFTSEGLMKRDATSGSYSIVTDNSSNWDTAYGWGDHSAEGYITSFDITTQTDPKYLRSDADDTTTGTITADGGFSTSTGHFATTTGNITSTYGSITVGGLVSAPNVDIYTTGSVTTNIATGSGGSGNTKVLNLATGYGTGGSTTVNICPASSTTSRTINLNGNVSVDGTVDGVDVGALKYHKEDYIMIRDGNNKTLSTSFVDLGSYTYIYDAATPMPTMRYLDINIKINWGYTTATNDLQVKVNLQVPSGTVTAQSIGSVTQTSGGGYATISSFEKWYHVSGDVTHLFTEFGKLHDNQSGGTFEKTVYAWQYNPDQNRTYFLMSTYPSAPATGTTLYWHPYGWESAGTNLIEYKDIDERYMSGNQYANIVTKTAYTDATLKYNLQIRELGSGDSGQVNQTYVKISKQEP